MRITGMSTPARNSETGKHTGARATATHPLELVQSWQSLKPLTTLGLVHAGRLTVTRGMQGLLSAPCQTVSATRAKFTYSFLRALSTCVVVAASSRMFAFVAIRLRSAALVARTSRTLFIFEAGAP